MNTVIVGMNLPGGRKEALSPRRICGGRLYRAMGIPADEYSLRFDRINLWVDDCRRRSVDNVLPLLRGRRVLALGRAVQETLQIPRMFSWGISPLGFIGGAIPHPSLRNLWWGNSWNLEKASDFLTPLLKPCIHVEGPDGSGKSCLVECLSERMGLKTLPTGNPPGTPLECLDEINRRIVPGIICDRSRGLISELVYGKVLRGKTLVEEEQLWNALASMIHSVRFIYCKIPPGRLSPNVREEESEDHIIAVSKNITSLCRRYDEVMNIIRKRGGWVLEYDWREGTDNLVGSFE